MKGLRELNICETKFCEIKICELDLEKWKTLWKDCEWVIFIAFTYLFMDFILIGKKSHKIEHTFKTHNWLKST